MSFLLRPITLPLNALSGDLTEDNVLALRLAPWITHARAFGQEEIRLPALHLSPALRSNLVSEIRRQGLFPVLNMHLNQEFAVATPDADAAVLLRSGCRLVVIIDQDPSAAALARMLSTLPYLEQISYVIVGKKDWRFRDAYRSLPAAIRSRLFFDFPLSLSPRDHYFEPAELKSVLRELEGIFGAAAVRAFDPHFSVRTELLSANITSSSCGAKFSETAPRLSIVTSDPERISQLEQSAAVLEFAEQIELIVPRVAGRKAKLVRGIKKIPISRLWLHVENPEKEHPELEAHLLNWAAQHASGSLVLFADQAGASSLDLLVQKAFAGESNAAEPLVDRQKFLAAGGFDPFYSALGLGELEFLYRYRGGMDPSNSAHQEKAESLRQRERGPFFALGLRAFLHQYLDFSFYYYFSGEPKQSSSNAQTGESNAVVLQQLGYRLEQSRDAYLTLYQASPRVALHGNLQVLLRPWHYLKPHLWRLKMPLYPLFVTPYHFVKPHLWHLKKLAYPGFRLYHFTRLAAGKLRGWAVQPYHFIRLNAWRLKTPFYFMRGNAWRVKQIYHLAFWLLFPLRKVYYFSEFQFEKRILGLHDRHPEVLGQE